MIDNIETPNYINLGPVRTLVGSHQVIGFYFHQKKKKKKRERRKEINKKRKKKKK
jgi:hypothetical protein